MNYILVEYYNFEYFYICKISAASTFLAILEAKIWKIFWVRPPKPWWGLLRVMGPSKSKSKQNILRDADSLSLAPNKQPTKEDEIAEVTMHVKWSAIVP